MPELDGVRILSRSSHEFLHEIPGETGPGGDAEWDPHAGQAAQPSQGTAGAETPSNHLALGSSVPSAALGLVPSCASSAEPPCPEQGLAG